MDAPILIFPYPKALRNGKVSNKNYPYWPKLISLLREYKLIQLGIEGEKQLLPDFRKNLPLEEVARLIQKCYFWISVDSWAQHLAIAYNKKGVVLWGTSHPKIFGYTNNINISFGDIYLRKDPYYWWEDEEVTPEAFVSAEEVYKIIEKEFLNKK